MQAYIVILLIGCSLVNCVPLPTGYTSGSAAEGSLPYDDVAVPSPDIPAPSDNAAVDSADVNVPYNDVAVPSSDVSVPYDDVVVPSADVPASDDDVPEPSADVPASYDDVAVPSVDVLASEVEVVVSSADVAAVGEEIAVSSADVAEPFAAIPVPYDIQLPAVEDTEAAFDLAAQEYPEAAYEEGTEVDYETSIDVLLNEVIGRAVNVEAPSPFGQGINGEDGPNSVVVHIANLPAGIPFEADFETDVNVDVADSSIHTLNVKVKPHSAY